MSHSEKKRGNTPRDSQNHLQSESEKWKQTSLVAGQMELQPWGLSQGKAHRGLGVLSGVEEDRGTGRRLQWPVSWSASPPTSRSQTLDRDDLKFHRWSGHSYPHEQDYKAEKAPVTFINVSSPRKEEHAALSRENQSSIHLWEKLKPTVSFNQCQVSEYIERESHLLKCRIRKERFCDFLDGAPHLTAKGSGNSSDSLSEQSSEQPNVSGGPHTRDCPPPLPASPLPAPG